MKYLIAFLALAAVAATAAMAADVKYVVQQSGSRIPGSRYVTYVKGDMERRDSKSAAGEVSTITRCASREVVTINWKCGTYLVEPLQPAAAPAQPAPRREQRRFRDMPARTGSVVAVEREIKDTGERATMLGLPARHVLLRMKLQAQPGACIEGNGEMEQDIWVADVPGAQASCTATLAQPFPQSPVAGCLDRYQVTDRGDAAILSGLPLRIGMSFVRPAVARDMSKERALAEGAAQKKAPSPDMVSEIVEISTSPLDASLFEAPANFKQAKSAMELHSCGASIRP